MATISHKISPMLWFDNQAEEAAKFYTSAFPNSRTGRISRYGKEGFEVHGQKEGTVITSVQDKIFFHDITKTLAENILDIPDLKPYYLRNPWTKNYTDLISLL